MIGNRITVLGKQEQQLKYWLTGHPLGHERGAIVLFRRLARKVKGLRPSDRLLAVEIIEMKDDWILESSKTHFKINMRKLPEIYLRCESEKLELGFLHNHPDGYNKFSSKDDVNEKNILRGLAGCNGKDSLLIAMILVNGKWWARMRQGHNPDKIIRIRHVVVLGEKMTLHCITPSGSMSPSLKRQEAAFGKPFNAMMQSLRVAVVGLGGTGSPTATLLARSGVGELILIDGDVLAKSNMNRVRGYVAKNIKKRKAKSLKKFIDSLGLNITVVAISKYVDAPESLDAISSADVIFGCTDDAGGRDLLNQAIYYHAQVLIDSGIAALVDKDESGIPYLRDQRGRVSCILPQFGACLRCQRVITEVLLKYERAIKDNPDLAKVHPETLEKEYYLRGGGARSPGVGPFTSATADYAVATLMDLIKPFRSFSEDLRQDNIWQDFKHMCIHSNEPLNDPDCIHCRNQLLLLKREMNHRLDTPLLGKIN